MSGESGALRYFLLGKGNMQFKYAFAPEVIDLIDWHNANSSYVVIDTETTGLNCKTDKLLDIQISGKSPDEVVMFSGDLGLLLKRLNQNITLVAHNYKFDCHMLYEHGVDLRSRPWRDTMLMHHLYNENLDHDLDSIIKEHWNDNYKELFWGKYENYHDAPEFDRLQYACKDIVYTNRLYLLLLEKLKHDAISDSLIQHVHHLAKSLLDTEIRGIKIDKEYLVSKGLELNTKLENLRPKLRNLVESEVELVELEMWLKELKKRKTSKGKANIKKPTFSFDSSSQVMHLLYDKLKLTKQFNEKTKNSSVDDASLEAIKSEHEIVLLLQEYRALNKVYTAYIEGTLERLSNGRIYPSFNVNGTATGRISHSNPNLGQLPANGGIRGMYVPEPGYVFIGADYSGQEVCIEANLTKDENLIKIFRDGLSKHDITANALNISRATAKTLNFALQYWCSHFKVAKILGCSEKDALEAYNRYWEEYKGCKHLKEKTDNMVNSGEPIISLFGRKRRFSPGKRPVWSGDYRQAYNFLIQGTGADITNKAFYLIDLWLKETGYGYGLFTVHDEVLISVKKEYSEIAEKKLIDTMVNISSELNLDIPLKVESSGPMDRWLD